MAKLYTTILMLLSFTSLWGQDTVKLNDAEREAVESIDYLYNSLSSKNEEIHRYLSSVPPEVDKKNLFAHYLAKLRQSCEEQDAAYIYRYAQTYLALGGDDDLPEVLTAAAKACASMGLETLSSRMVSQLEAYSEENEGWLDEEVATLKVEVAKIARERKRAQRCAVWAEAVKGYWVALNWNKTSFPMIVEITSPISSKGAYLIDPRIIKIQQVSKRWEKVKNVNPLGVSSFVRFDGNNRSITVGFQNRDIKDRTWLAGAAQSGLEGVRDTRTRMNTTIRTSNATLGEKLAATAITSLTTSLLDNMFDNMVNSSINYESYEISMYPDYGICDLMEANIHHFDQTVYNTGRVSTWDNKTTRHTFVRWEEEDSIVFASPSGEPIAVGNIATDSPLLQEINSIKRHYAWYNPRLLFPRLLALGMCGYISYCGLSALIGSISLDYTSIRHTTMFSLGLTGIIFSAAFLFRNATNTASPEYEALNDRNLKKLKEKRQMLLAFGPSYNPSNDALGAALNVSF